MKTQLHWLLLLFLFILHVYAQKESNYALGLASSAQTTAATKTGGRKLMTVYDAKETQLYLASTLDGNLHGIDIDKGEIKWTLKTPPGGPLLTSSNIAYSDADVPPVQVIPSVNGNIYLHVNGESGVQKLPLTAKELVDMSPFLALDGTMYMSSKQTTGFLVNIHTGKVKCILRDRKQPYSHDDSAHQTCTTQEAYDQEDAEEDLVFLVRVDYAINAIDSASGRVKWNITFSDCHPSSQHADIPTSMAFSTNDGGLYYIENTNIPVPTRPTIFQFSSQPISLFRQVPGTAQFQRVNMLHITLAGGHGFNPYMDDDPAVYVSSDSNGRLYAFEINPLLLLKSKQDRLSLPSPPPSHQINITPSADKEPPIEEPQGETSILGIHQLRPFTYQQCLNPDVLLRHSKYDRQLQIEPMDTKCKQFDENGQCVMRIEEPETTRIAFWNNRAFVISTVLSILAIGFFGVRLVIVNQKKVEHMLQMIEQQRQQLQEASQPPTKVSTPEDKDLVLVGKIHVLKKKVLGHGSNGTIVFEGELVDHNNRKIAVKRMLREFFEIAKHEVSLLIESDEHPNIVRYFAREEDEQFVYLALELCDQSLEKFVAERKPKSKKNKQKYMEQKMQLLFQLCKAVEHLHKLNIVHRDLKPQNVLISSDGVVKISDMGLGRRLSSNKTSFHTNNGSAGTVGWQAPELLQDENEGQPLRKTRAVDIFALGCILYYVLTDGGHPFGDRLEREYNILNDKPKFIHVLPLEMIDLIQQMIHHDPAKRPKASEVIQHPAFWSDSQRLAFLGDVSDQLGKEQMTSQVYHDLQNKAAEIWKGETWEKYIDTIVLQNVQSFRKYDHKKVWDLLRMMRNMKGHFREYDSQVQEMMQPLPQGIYRYFSSKFPSLFFVVYKTVRESDWIKLPVFQPYFQPT